MSTIRRERSMRIVASNYGGLLCTGLVLGATAAVLEIPDLGDPTAIPTTARDQIPGLPLECCPPPAVAAARAMLIGKRHGLAVDRLLLGRQPDVIHIRGETLGKPDRDVVW